LSVIVIRAKGEGGQWPLAALRRRGKGKREGVENLQVYQKLCQLHLEIYDLSHAKHDRSKMSDRQY